MTYTPISRQAAFDQGLSHFYTGRPCKHGHDAQRIVASGACAQCVRGYSKAYARAKNGAFVTVTFTQLHPDDAAALRDTCAALQAARDATTSAKPFDAAAARAQIYGPNADASMPHRMTPK